MEVIKAVQEKDKKLNLIKYSFNAENETFTANYIYTKNQKLEFFHNGNQAFVIDKTNNKANYVVHTESGDLNINAWLENSGFPGILYGKQGGAGIEINGRPVQFTISDPDTHIKSGRTALFILLFILAFKTVWTYYTTYTTLITELEAAQSHLISLITISIYFIALILVLIAALKYNAWLNFSLIAGGILAVLELVDYLLAIPATLQSNTNPVMIVFWILLRVSVLYLLFNAFNWKERKYVYVVH